MKAMERNSYSKEGAENLMGAIKNKHDGSLLDNLSGLFEGGVENSVTKDGNKILSHILGSKKQGVEKVIGEKTGLNANAIGDILKTSAPILMNILGEKAKEKNINSSNDITGLIGSLLGGNEAKEEQSFLEKVLDADGDGSIIDDVAGLLLKSSKGKNGMGGIIGKLFGK